MNIEFNQILTFVSVVAAVYFAFKSNSRANNDEVSKKAQVDAILSQKLDSISDDTKEIRKEITDVKVKVNDLSERVVMVEQSTKSAHHRLWIALIPAVLLLVQVIAAVFGYTLDLGELGDKLLAVVNALFAVLTILGIVTDPTTAGIGDSKQALTYETPKKEDAV